MHAIFNKETEDLLLELGVAQGEIDKIKFKELKSACLDRLRDVFDNIRDDNFDAVFNLLGDSPSGDGYGCDNRYIYFGDITQFDDIGDICNELNAIKGRMTKKS